MHPIHIWALAAMVYMAPPDKLAALPAFRGWEETAEQRSARYVEIERAAYDVAFDPSERPAFAGARARVLTEAALLAFADHESGYDADVDLGPCYRGKEGKSKRCDSGLSACLLQIRIGAGTTAEGWTQADLFADRRKCFRAGLHLIRKGTCPNNKPEQRWAAVASGRCDVPSKEAAGLAATFRRMTEAPAPRLPLDADVSPPAGGPAS